MALGGGTFITQNKVLPGTYVNVFSMAHATATLSDRGSVAVALEFDWGTEGSVFEVTSGDFQKHSVRLFGYDYSHDSLRPLREIFRKATIAYLYRLNSAGVKAKQGIATARWGGIRGNDIKFSVLDDLDAPGRFLVNTYLGTTLMDTQAVGESKELKDNDFIQWDTTKALELAVSTPLIGGTNGTEVTVAEHQTFLDKSEPFGFHAMGVASIVPALNGLYSAHCKRMRDEVGAKFQLVAFNTPSDYMGVVNVKNKVATENEKEQPNMVYWTLGAVAGCAVNASLSNQKYDGEYAVDVELTQNQLIRAIGAGEFVFHRVGSDVNVLMDLNSYTSFTEQQGEVFADNWTIRVVDQLANDSARVFNTRYLGKFPNGQSERIALHSDLSRLRETLQRLGAIESFLPEDMVVERGEKRTAVTLQEEIQVLGVMLQLYMTTVVA